MDPIGWDRRFLPPTRRRIVSLLRRGSRTVDELAQALALTSNGVRSHLVTLERDGLVTQGRVRRTGGKPAQLYELTVESERLFAQAYAPVLDELLTVLADRLGEAETEETLRAVGRRLAGSTTGETDLQSRLDSAVNILNRLGGDAESIVEDKHVVIRGYGCPLTAISARHCEICQLAEALVTEIVGLPMRERCERGERPRCRFEGTLDTGLSD